MIMVGEAGVAALTLFLDGKARGWLEEQGVCQVTLPYLNIFTLNPLTAGAAYIRVFIFLLAH